MNVHTFRVIIEPDENNSYHGFVPSLPGCHTVGNSIEETKANLREAIICHVQGLMLDHEPIPHDDGAFEVIQIFSATDFDIKEEDNLPAHATSPINKIRTTC